jgi:hypothetical protein
MSGTGWWGHLLDRLASTCRLSLALDEDGVRLFRGERLTNHVHWADLVRVEVVTTDQGPWHDDFFYVLTDAGGARVVVPSEMPGSGDLLERLQKLPGFDNEQIIEAASTVTNATFLCWQRDPAHHAAEGTGSSAG